MPKHTKRGHAVCANPQHVVLAKFLRFLSNDLLQFPANELSLPRSRNWCYYIKNRRARRIKQGSKENHDEKPP